MNELDELRRAVEHRRDVIARADANVDEAVLAAYRAKRDDGTPLYTLTEIGEALGVTRQRVYQLVRQVAARADEAERAGSRTAARGA